MKQITRNFHEREFRCRCKERGYTDLLSYCGGLSIYHPSLVEKLQEMRDKAKKPIIITSGYRCPAYNRRPENNGGVGGADWSQHMLGRAADIVIEGWDPVEVAALAEEVGFVGIGIYNTFVHVDVRDGAPARWDYRTGVK